MEQLQFDTGLRSYRIGGGVLRFNPADPNVYARFLEAADRLTALEESVIQQAKTEAALPLLSWADGQVKDILKDIFGDGNDFDGIFGGVNLLAVGQNGQRVITNFLAALEPVLTEGARRCAAQEAAAL